MVRGDFKDLVDLQVNGYGGVDFSSETLDIEQIHRLCEDLAARGTGRFLATLVTAPLEIYERNLGLLCKAIEQDSLVHDMIVGFHLEGPFISPEKGARGAHDPRFIQKADLNILKQLLYAGKNHIRMLTVAPELEGIETLIRAAREHNIIVSMGHSLANYYQIERAVLAGASCATHVGNGIPALLPRTDNPIVSFLSIPELNIFLITDGHHLPLPFINMAIRTCGLENLVVTSDSAPLGGMPPGHYVSLGGNVVLEPDGRLHIPSEGCLAGSSFCLAECAQFLQDHTKLTKIEIEKVVKLNPSRLLGLPLA